MQNSSTTSCVAAATPTLYAVSDGSDPIALRVVGWRQVPGTLTYEPLVELDDDWVEPLSEADHHVPGGGTGKFGALEWRCV